MNKNLKISERFKNSFKATMHTHGVFAIIIIPIIILVINLTTSFFGSITALTAYFALVGFVLYGGLFVSLLPVFLTAYIFKMNAHNGTKFIIYLGVFATLLFATFHSYHLYNYFTSKDPFVDFSIEMLRSLSRDNHKENYFFFLFIGFFSSIGLISLFFSHKKNDPTKYLKSFVRFLKS